MGYFMRADGIKLKNVDPMYYIASFVMDKRYDAMNMITINIPREPLDEYVREKRKQGINISHMAIILAAYVRVMGEFPELNRFIVNKKPYARKELSVSMVVLKAGSNGHGMMSKMYFDKKNTIFEVNDIINRYVDENRNEPDNNGTEKLMKILLSVPGLMPIGVKFIKFMDKHGLLPKSVIDMSPFHASLLISNLASIRTNHIYHHVYEFGTTSLSITLGNTHEVPKRKGDEVIFEKCIPFGVVMDERIASGSYFAMAFRRLRQYLNNPEILETPLENVVEDDGIKTKKK
ncbi:MAG: hypothetical protein IKZ47_05435 [Clostridia bacterium]|nr:hypothetical protein [Clostridia bacterium]